MISKYDHLVPSVKAALPNELVSRFDDNDFQRALIARKGNVMEATALLQKYCHIRLDYPKIYEKMTAKTVEKVLDSVVLGTVSGIKTKDGMTVFYIDGGSWDPSVLPLEEYWAALCMMSDLVSILCPETMDPGYLSITDLGGVSLKHIRGMNPRVHGRASHCFYESMISFEKKNYQINSSFFVEMGNKASRPFLPKIVSEIYLYVKKEKLTDVLGEDIVQNKKYLPTSEDVAKYKKLVKDNLPILLAKYERMML